MFKSVLLFAVFFTSLSLAGCGGDSGPGDIVADESEIAKYISENPDSGAGLDSTDMPDE